MMTWQTTAQVAALLGVSERAIRARGKRYGVGTAINARMTIYSEADITIMRAHTPGKRGRPKRA